MGDFRRNIHYNIQVGLDARINAMNEYHTKKNPLRSSLLSPTKSTDDFTISKEGQIGKSTYIRMISPGMKKTHVIYGQFNIDDIGGLKEPGAGDDYFKGVSERILGAAGGYYEAASDNISLTGLRPKAGITNLNILFQGYGGAVRKATVTWTCFSLEQLAMYQKGSFLSPGQNIILDWGWVRSDKSSANEGHIPKFLVQNGEGVRLNEDLFKDEVEEIDGEKFHKYSAEWDDLELTQYGDWGGMIGPVSKFTWSQRDDGGFDCITELISRGANIFEKQIPSATNEGAEQQSFPVKAPTFDEFVHTVLKEAIDEDVDAGDFTGDAAFALFSGQKGPALNIAERIGSLDYEIITKYFTNEITAEDDMSAALTMETDYKVLASEDQNVYAILRKEGSDGNDSASLYEAETDDEGENTDVFNRARDFASEIWVRWGWFEDNVVNYYFRDGVGEGNDFKRLVEFRSLVWSAHVATKTGTGFGRAKSVYISNSEFLQTYDPSIFILAGKYEIDYFAASKDDTVLDKSYYMLAKMINASKYLFHNKENDPKDKGKLRNIYINLSVIKKSFSSPGVSVQSAMLKMAESLNSGIQIWNFIVDSTGSDSNKFSSAKETFRIREESGADATPDDDDECRVCTKDGASVAESQKPGDSYIFSNYGENSLVHDLSLTSTVPDKFASVAGFGMTSGKGELRDDAIRAYFSDGSTSTKGEDEAKAIASFFADYENISTINFSRDKSESATFGHIGGPDWKPVGELHKEGIPVDNGWNHVITQQLIDSSPTARVSFREQFEKKYALAQDKLWAEAAKNRDMGKPFDVEDLFPYPITPGSKTSMKDRAPYDDDGKLRKHFMKAMKWILEQAPLTRITSDRTEIIMPINIDMTIEGCGGLYPGNMFRLTYLPENYGQVNFQKDSESRPPTTYFSVMGVTHTVNAEGWQTKIQAITNKTQEVYEAVGEEEVKALKEAREKMEKAYNSKMRLWSDPTLETLLDSANPNSGFETTEEYYERTQQEHLDAGGGVYFEE